MSPYIKSFISIAHPTRISIQSHPYTLKISLSWVSGNFLAIGDGFPNTSLVLVEHGCNSQDISHNIACSLWMCALQYIAWMGKSLAARPQSNDSFNFNHVIDRIAFFTNISYSSSAILLHGFHIMEPPSWRKWSKPLILDPLYLTIYFLKTVQTLAILLFLGNSCKNWPFSISYSCLKTWDWQKNSWDCRKDWKNSCFNN